MTVIWDTLACSLFTQSSKVLFWFAVELNIDRREHRHCEWQLTLCPGMIQIKYLSNCKFISLMKGLQRRGRGSIGSKADDIVGPFLVPEDDAGQSLRPISSHRTTSWNLSMNRAVWTYAVSLHQSNISILPEIQIMLSDKSQTSVTTR